jgi:hypothetical protein
VAPNKLDEVPVLRDHDCTGKSCRIENAGIWRRNQVHVFDVMSVDMETLRQPAGEIWASIQIVIEKLIQDGSSHGQRTADRPVNLLAPDTRIPVRSLQKSNPLRKDPTHLRLGCAFHEYTDAHRIGWD